MITDGKAVPRKQQTSGSPQAFESYMIERRITGVNSLAFLFGTGSIKVSFFMNYILP